MIENRSIFLTIVIAVALYWLSLIYGCFIADVVAPTDFYKESGGLLATIIALHIKLPQKTDQVNVRGEDVTVQEDPKTPAVL